MSWKPLFNKAVACFRSGNYHDAIKLLTEAINNGGSDQYVLYDSRSAALEKLGRRKDALRDARTVIQLVPAKWHGYSRAARLFFASSKHEQALQMVALALERVPEATDQKRNAELLHLRQEILSHQSKYRYHLGSLPLELCVEIFIALVEESHRHLLPLLAVCHKWRSVVSSTPALWRTLSLDVKKPAWKAKRWIERSCGGIHTLIVPPRVFRGDWYNGVLETLRWDRLETCIVQDADAVTYIRVRNLVSNCRALNHLHLASGRLSSDDISPFFALQNIHNTLKSLYLNHYSLRWQLFSNLTHLTSFSLVSCIVIGEGLLPFLRNNPGLESLRLASVFEEESLDSPEIPDSMLPLPALRCLDIGNSNLPLSIIASAFAAPNIQTLRLCHVPGCIDADLERFLATGLHFLEELSIEHTLCGSGVIVRCLPKIPKLRVLVLRGLTDVVGPVLEALASTDRGILCPCLEHLNVNGCPDAKGGPIMRIVKRALETSATNDDNTLKPSRIRVLQMDGCSMMDPEVLAWLRRVVPSVSCVYMTKKEASYRR